MEKPPDILALKQKHSPGQSVLFHLLPGLLGGVLYYLLVSPLRELGYPSLAALIAAGLLGLLPFEVGVLIIQAKRMGSRSFLDSLAYRESLSRREYLLWVPVIFISSGILMTVLGPVSSWLEGLFSWIPAGFRLDMGLEGGYSKTVLIITYLAGFLAVAVIVPVVEELYFRGFLLPRIPAGQFWAPLIHSALFALYHTWTPWMAPARFLAVLPLIYIVRWKKNLMLGIAAHCLINVIDIIIGLIYIINLP